MDCIFKYGKWIRPKEQTGVNQYYDYHDWFTIEKIENTFLFVSVDSQYELYLNGRFVDCGQFSDYVHYKVYDRILLDAYLQSGNNEIKLVLFYEGVSNSTYKKAEIGAVFEIHQEGKCLCASNENTSIRCNPYYKQGEIEAISPQRGFTFHYDANGTIVGNIGSIATDIDKYTFYERVVDKISIKDKKCAYLISQGVFKDAAVDCEKGITLTVAEKMQYAFLSYREPEEFLKNEEHQKLIGLPSRQGVAYSAQEHILGVDGIYLVLDLQEESVGFLCLDVEVDEACDIQISYGEHLDDLRIRAAVGGRNFACSYRAKKGRQQYTYYMKRTGLRYLQLHIYAKNFKLYYVGIKEVAYPVNYDIEFSCSDGLHQKIFEVCKKTLHLCMHDHYEDTPWREQALYSMDSRNQMICGYYAFGEYRFPKGSLELMACSQRIDGLLELCAPAEVEITIPSFSLIFIVSMQEYLSFSGDKAFVSKYVPVLQRILDAFESRRGANLLIENFKEEKYWNFYEWQQGLDGGDIFRTYEIPCIFDVPLNAFYSLALQAYSKICKILENKEESGIYCKRARELNKALDQFFWSASDQAYKTFLNGDKPHFCELVQSLMLVCNAVPKEKIKKVVEKLMSHQLLPITLSHSIFKYEAILKHDPEKLDLVLNEIKDVWGKMLFQNATSFWETKEGAQDFNRAGSLCHGWSAIPIYIYYAYGLGIRPGSEGQIDRHFIPHTNLNINANFIESPNLT